MRGTVKVMALVTETVRETVKAMALEGSYNKLHHRLLLQRITIAMITAAIFDIADLSWKTFKILAFMFFPFLILLLWSTSILIPNIRIIIL